MSLGFSMSDKAMLGVNEIAAKGAVPKLPFAIKRRAVPYDM
jgi:hypothetical protein